MKVYLDSIGCRLNQSEIEKFALQFRAAGHTIVASPAEADLVVVNTCAVTAEAASDSRQKIRQAARFTPGGITVTGCWATLDRAGAMALPGVDRVVLNDEKDTLVSTVLGIPSESFDLEPLARQPLPGLHTRTRAFIKVQDGCDNHCTFCVTRLARGKGRSRSISEILSDIRVAQAGGAKEVVLTGVHLGSWGQDFTPKNHLRDLIQAVLQGSDVPRLRLSSLEPWDLDESFFSLWKNSRLCRHLHLPLQSGCSATLKRMARKTTPQQFEALVKQARELIPDVAITTDIIVGFPGETEEEFQESLDFVARMQFAGGHVFTYSDRAGTAATRLPNPVPSEVRKRRNALMREVIRLSSQRYLERFLGSEVIVLWESTDSLGPSGWNIHGLTDHYIKVVSQAKERLWNQFSRVKLLEVDGDRIKGEILEIFPD
jgi:threonylcarbamoyladenosine tRNA methylthiotransferase MtaB